MLKYRNIKTTVDGMVFDSKKEASRYCELKMLLKAGMITELETQPEYEIIPSVRWNGKKLRVKKYKADFRYFENGKEIVEDVKGYRTQVYMLKRQLFITQNPGVEFRET